MTPPEDGRPEAGVARRAFLIGGAAGLIGGFAAAQIGPLIGELTAPPPATPPGPGQQMIALLREYFSYLEFDDSVATQFVLDYARHYGPVEDAGRFFATFLLSTDFFENGQDESRPLQYVALYGPMLNPCLNPLGQTA